MPLAHTNFYYIIRLDSTRQRIHQRVLTSPLPRCQPYPIAGRRSPLHFYRHSAAPGVGRRCRSASADPKGSVRVRRRLLRLLGMGSSTGKTHGPNPLESRNRLIPGKMRWPPRCRTASAGATLEGGDHHVQRRATLRGNLNLMPFTNTTYLAPHALVTPAGFSGPAYLVVLPVPHIIITNIRFSIFNYLEGLAPALTGLRSIESRRLARLDPTPAFTCNYTGFAQTGRKRNAGFVTAEHDGQAAV